MPKRIEYRAWVLGLVAATLGNAQFALTSQAGTAWWWYVYAGFVVGTAIFALAGWVAKGER